MLPEALVAPLVTARTIVDGHPSQPMQAVAADFMDQGHFAAHLRLMRQLYRGRRDALLMCLLLDHGLRVSEVADLQVTDLDLSRGLLRFYRRKVAVSQTHRLTSDTLRAAKCYLDAGDAPAVGQLLRTAQRSSDRI